MAPRESNALIPVTMPILPKWAHLPRTASSSSSQTHSSGTLETPVCGRWQGREAQAKAAVHQTRHPPPRFGRWLVLTKLILSLLSKFFEGKKANKKTHSSKGTPLIFFFHPLKLDRKRKTT